MTSDAVVRRDPGAWPLRRRQAWQTMRMELARTFTVWGSLRLLFLAFAPAFIIGSLRVPSI